MLAQSEGEEEYRVPEAEVVPRKYQEGEESRVGPAQPWLWWCSEEKVI